MPKYHGYDLNTVEDFFCSGESSSLFKRVSMNETRLKKEEKKVGEEEEDEEKPRWGGKEGERRKSRRVN